MLLKIQQLGMGVSYRAGCGGRGGEALGEGLGGLGRLGRMELEGKTMHQPLTEDVAVWGVH